MSNKIKNRFFLLLVGMLLNCGISFAQIVQVPAGCTVVSQGTVPAGTAANFVGEGGIVGMPDPGVGGTFAFTSPVGAVLSGAVTWKLKGDISTTNALSIPADPTSFYNAATQTASGNATNIISYNKSLRVTEGVAPSIKTWARSKGRVTVGYTVVVSGILTCGNSITFEIFKIFPGSVQLNPANIAIQPTNIPKIVGPDCIEVGKPCTFSVDQVASDNASDAIGFDSYYWVGLPAFATNSRYFSADNSSVTFIPTTNAGFTIKCSVGKLNANIIPSGPGPDPITLPLPGTTYNASVSKIVGAAPILPTFAGTSTIALSTTTPPCLNTGVSSFTINYAPVNSGAGVWSAPNTGWSINPVTYNGSVYSVTVNTPNNNPGILTLTVTNGTCPTLSVNYQINRKFVSATITPILPATNCLDLGSNNKFTVGDNGLENPISWSLSAAPSAGATGVALAVVPLTPNSTTAVTVTASASVNTVYTLIANATACPYAPANTSPNTYVFSIKPNKPTITAGNGSACVTKGALTAKVFNCVSSVGATYTWTFPAGWGVGPITTTNPTLTLTPISTTAAIDGTVSVVANGGVSTCSNTASFTVNYDSVAPTGVVANCISLGVAGSASVLFSNPQTGTYTATMISTIVGSTNVITSAVTLNSSTLSFSTSALAAGNYNIAITHDSGCGVVATSTTLINVGGNGTLYPGTTDNYVAVAPSTMINPQYEWTTCTSAGVCTPVGGNSALLALSGASAPPAGNTVCVTVYPLGSTCKTRLCLAQGTHSRMANTVMKGETIDGITIYPNPNNGIFTIKLDKVRLLATATLNDATGREIATYILKKGDNKIEKEGLPSGVYAIVLEVDGKTETRQLIIK